MEIRKNVRRWHLGWWFLAILLAACPWAGWREYDYRAAIREAKAAGYKWESRGPFVPTLADWPAGLEMTNWMRHRRLDLGEDADLARARILLHRLRPTELWTRRCLNTDLDALKGLTSLHMLSLGGSSALQNVGGLKGLTGMQWLDLSDCPALQNVDGLKRLTSLKQLYLNHCPALQNVDGLQGLAALQSLDLSDCPALQNVDGLKGLTGLQWLNLSGSTKIPAAALRELLLALPETDIFVPPNGSKAPPP